MQAFFSFLAANPYILLFLTVGLAVWIGRQSIAGYGLGMVAAAIVVGCGLSVWASTYGAKLELNNFTRLLFYYLFMYGVGLRVGPSFVNSLGGDGIKFSVLSVVSCVIGLALVVVGREAVRPSGRGRGRHAGRVANYVRGDRLGRASRAGRRGEASPGQHARGGQRHDRAFVRHHLHLGHSRNRPDHEISAAMVGHRRARRRPAPMRRSTEWPAATSRPSLAGPPAACAPTGSRTRCGKARPCAISSSSIPNTAALNLAREGVALGRGLRREAATRRRHHARRPARGDDREDGPDRP